MMRADVEAKMPPPQSFSKPPSTVSVAPPVTVKPWSVPADR